MQQNDNQTTNDKEPFWDKHYFHISFGTVGKRVAIVLRKSAHASVKRLKENT